MRGDDRSAVWLLRDLNHCFWSNHFPRVSQCSHMMHGLWVWPLLRGFFAHMCFPVLMAYTVLCMCVVKFVGDYRDQLCCMFFSIIAVYNNLVIFWNVFLFASANWEWLNIIHVAHNLVWRAADPLPWKRIQIGGRYLVVQIPCVDF